MRLLISHVYSSRNKGDSAILSCQLKELRRVFDDVLFEVLTLERSHGPLTFEGVPLQPSLMSTVMGGGAPRMLRPMLGVGMMASTLTWAAVARATGVLLPMPGAWRKPLQSIYACDAQVCVGGGYLRAKNSFHSTYRLVLLVHQIVLARILDKPVYLYAQSFGPFPGVSQALIFQAIARLCSLILPRESISFAVAQHATAGRVPVTRVIDSAFLIEHAGAPRALDRFFASGRPQTVVGMTVREWLDGTAQDDYECAVRELIDAVIARGAGVLLIPQVTATEQRDDDRIVGRRLAAHYRGEKNFVLIEEDLELGELLAMYASLDFLVGTRFHSVIFALCAGVPCLAIEYEHKTSGILRDLDLEEWVVPIEVVTGKALIALFDRLVARRAELVPKIERAAFEARRQASLGANLIAEHYRSVTLASAARRDLRRESRHDTLGPG